MSLKFVPKQSYKTKVEVFIPLDFGKTEKVTFTAEFRRLNFEQSKACIARVMDAARNPVGEQDIDAEVIRENLIGWEGLPAEGGGNVEYSSQVLEEMLTHTCYRVALARRFIDDLSAHKEPARKN